VYGIGDADRSLLAGVGRLVDRAATATLRGDEMVLAMPRAAAREIADRIAAGQAAAVLPGRDPALTAALVWAPGQVEPEATCEEGTDTSAVAAAFVMLLPQDSPTDVIRFLEDGCAAILSTSSAKSLVRFLEDGCAAILSTSSAKSLVEALRQSSAYSLPDPDSGRVLTVVANDELKAKVVSPNNAYHNPVDQKTYVAQGGWKTCQPEVPRPDELGKKVKTEQVRLLTSQDDLGARTTVKELVEFIKQAERLSEESLGKGGSQFKLLVQFKCTPGGHEVSLAHDGSATPELLQRLYDELGAAKKLSVRSGEVSFQIEMSVSP
jgi:hypothetical protein